MHVSDMQCRFPGTLRLTRKGLIHGSRSVIPTLCTEARIPSQRIQSSLCQQSSKCTVCVYLPNVILLSIIRASIRIWENLRFTKAGRIPRAGRLKRKDGQGEEYVDALVFYKSFEDEIENPSAQQRSIT